jgi:heavy metal efflux system protein
MKLKTTILGRIGSDTQKPFAIVIVAGLVSRLFIGLFVNPVLYEFVAHERRRLAGLT